ncbi:hypothetical protein OH77DRAFT_1417462 [Trametes cingulata]|nr:hypothetical protein OH77DRAFT_1417462 [Trametes cingulata]
MLEPSSIPVLARPTYGTTGRWPKRPLSARRRVAALGVLSLGFVRTEPILVAAHNLRPLRCSCFTPTAFIRPHT